MTQVPNNWDDLKVFCEKRSEVFYFIGHKLSEWHESVEEDIQQVAYQ